MNNISSWEAETKELIERVLQELKDAMTQVDMLQQRKWALEEAMKTYAQMRGTQATRTIKWLNPDSVKDKSYREVLSLIARENDGLLIVRHATRLMKEAQAFGDSPNADSIVYSILNRSSEFVRVGRGVYKLNSVHKEIKSTVRKERILGLKQAILELKTVNPDMTKGDVRDTLIRKGFDFQGKNPNKLVHILWVNLGYAKKDKEAQQNLFHAKLKRKGGDIMASTYRRKRGSDTWHFCSNCSNWPTSDYEERPVQPTSGELCNECRAKKNVGDCR